MDCIEAEAVESVAASRKNYDVEVRCMSGVRDRYYDPAMGRYVTSDPIGLKGGLNTYVYVEANPLKYYDFRGLELEGKPIRPDPEPSGSEILPTGIPAVTTFCPKAPAGYKYAGEDVEIIANVTCIRNTFTGKLECGGRGLNSGTTNFICKVQCNYVGSCNGNTLTLAGSCTIAGNGFTI